MQVDLAGRIAAVSGGPPLLNAAISEALTRNGATLARGTPAQCDILIHLAGSPAEAATVVAPRARAMPAGGRVVLVTSALAGVAMRGEAEAGMAAAGVAHLTRALALACGRAGVLVNAVAVGMLEGDTLTDRQSSHAALGPVTPADIANAVLFLADPDNSYTHGHVLTVDSGWSAGFARDF